VLERFGRHRPVVIRLADIGGDKDVPYLGLPAEDNPFLGVRAVRLAVDSPDLLVVQVRAIMRAATAAGVTANIMAPMVATLEDVDLLEAIVGQARRELPAGADARLRLGVMIEVPSAVLLIRELAARVAFVSIGTNDLTQYLFAADRTNARLARYQQATHPAVLRAIAAVVDGAHGSGIQVAVCGELAGDPAGARLLAGLGVDELSMGYRSIGPVAEALSTVTMGELATAARAALDEPC
jgi:phosphocarrier protein FPr